MWMLRGKSIVCHTNMITISSSSNASNDIKNKHLKDRHLLTTWAHWAPLKWNFKWNFYYLFTCSIRLEIFYITYLIAIYARN